jgi:hypothetical protein
MESKETPKQLRGCMSTAEMSTSFRLCIFCRRLEPAGQSCPRLGQIAGFKEPAEPSTKSTCLPQDDQDLIESLQQQPSSLCRRCSSYNIRRLFGPDELPLNDKAATDDISDAPLLGKLSSLHLASSCQLCRLIYCLMPVGGLDPEDDVYILEPFRSYEQEVGWNALSEEDKSHYACLLGLNRTRMRPAPIVTLGSGWFYEGSNFGPSIALSPPPPGRDRGNRRPVDRDIDFTMLKRHLGACLRTHGGECQSAKSQRLLETKVVDICARKVIPMPKDCAYVALSYVWGGVRLEKGSLEARTLPATIEDAITATQRLGMQYIWVDALCIDQTPDPTPEQAAEKQLQLNMMDLIYSGAVVVLCAVSGTCADSGLPGVSLAHPRPKQIKEVLGGDTLFIAPPHYRLSINNSTWATRAWTYQESGLSMRSISFTEHQWHFRCRRGSLSESDAFDGPVATLQSPDTSPSGSSGSLHQLMMATAPTTPATMFHFYGFLLSNYTTREMTNDSDSLNAVLGIISFLEKALDQPKFILGLPLRTYPAALAWMHASGVMPRRRADFPSWSWVGWEGKAVYSQGMIVETQEDDFPMVDLEPEVISDQGRELELKGWVVSLDIFTEPLSEVYVPDVNGSVTGYITEGSELHPNTLPTGKYSCLVARRVREKPRGDGPGKQSIFMIVLDWVGGVARRKTMLKLYVRANFMRLNTVWRTVVLV